MVVAYESFHTIWSDMPLDICPHWGHVRSIGMKHDPPCQPHSWVTEREWLTPHLVWVKHQACMELSCIVTRPLLWDPWIGKMLILSAAHSKESMAQFNERTNGGSTSGQVVIEKPEQNAKDDISMCEYNAEFMYQHSEETTKVFVHLIILNIPNVKLWRTPNLKRSRTPVKSSRFKLNPSYLILILTRLVFFADAKSRCKLSIVSSYRTG